MSCSKTSKPDSKPASSIRPDIFQGLITRHLQGTREYKSVDSKVVEMTGSDDDLSTVRSFVVKVNEMRRWLENDVSGGEKGGGDNKTRLRVILGSGLRGEHGEYVGQGMSLGDAGPSMSVATMPFSQDDYQLVQRTFRLPEITRLLFQTGGATPLRGPFYVSQLSGDEEKPVFGFMLKTFSSLLVGIKTSVSLSYDLGTGVINAFLFGSEPPDELVWLENDLRHLAPLATNPFLLPTLICQRLTEAIYIAIDNTFNKLHRAEMSSGQTGIGVIGEDGNIMRPGRCDDPHLPVTILGVSQLAISIEAYAEGHLLTVKSVKEELGRFPWDLLPEDKKRRARAQNGIIGRHLDWIVHTLKLAKIRAGHLRQRADVQTAAINNLLAQRNNETNRVMVEASTSIAHDTRRDSAAMKSIAILTLVFLPATFTAVKTYFGTPAVVAIKPSQGIYWAITVVLTVVVVLAWLTFFYGWVTARLPLPVGTETRKRS